LKNDLKYLCVKLSFSDLTVDLSYELNTNFKIRKYQRLFCSKLSSSGLSDQVPWIDTKTLTNQIEFLRTITLWLFADGKEQITCANHIQNRHYRLAKLSVTTQSKKTSLLAVIVLNLTKKS
jgi:hypothetical protein